MKRNATIPAFVAVTLLFAGACTSESLPSPEATGTLTLMGGIPSVKTSVTAVEDNSLVPSWNTGDACGVFVGTPSGSPTILTNTASTGASARFTGVASIADGDHTFFAFYPADAFASASSSSVVLSLPQVQTPSVGTYDPAADLLVSPASTISVSGGEGASDLMFARVVSLLAVRVTDATTGGGFQGRPITSIEISAEDAALAGDVTIAVSSGASTPSSVSTGVTAVLSDPSFTVGGSTPAYLLVLPCDLSEKDLVLKVVAGGEEYVKRVTAPSGMTLERGGARRLTIQIADTTAEGEDTHEIGHVFFEDNLDWIATYWNAIFPKYGWTSNMLDGSHYNEYKIGTYKAMREVFEGKGYRYDTNANVRYEGYLKLGTSSISSSVTLPALAGIDVGCTADVAVTFDTGLYFASSGTADTEPSVPVQVEGSGRITACGTSGATISADGKSAVIPLDSDDAHKWVWTRKQFIVSGADSGTCLTFGEVAERKNRIFLDAFQVVKAAPDAAPASDAVIVPDLDYEVVCSGTTDASAKEMGLNVRVNRAWTLTSDSPWLKIAAIAAGTDTGGVEIDEAGLSASAPGTALPYNRSFLSVEANPDEGDRTATLVLRTSDGDPVTSFSITQEGAAYTKSTVAKWTFTGLTASSTNGAAWLSDTHTVPSDVVEGGTLSASIAHASPAYSLGTTTQLKNRLRVNKISKDDSIDFSVDGLTLAAGSQIEVANLQLCFSAVATCPGNWVAEYSFDGGYTWTTAAEFSLETKTNAAAFDVGFRKEIEDAVTDATLRIRYRVVDNTALNGAAFTDGASGIVILCVGSALSNNGTYADSGATDKDKAYDSPWAYIEINTYTK